MVVTAVLPARPWKQKTNPATPRLTSPLSLRSPPVSAPATRPSLLSLPTAMPSRRSRSLVERLSSGSSDLPALPLHLQGRLAERTVDQSCSAHSPLPATRPRPLQRATIPLHPPSPAAAT